MTMISGRRKTAAATAVVGAVTVATLLGTQSPGVAAMQAAGFTTTKASVTVPDWTFPTNETSLLAVERSIRADAAYAQGITGKGVGIALIDTGVAPVPGLTSGNVVNGPDLSLESQVPSLLHKDGYGHGTHMAGIMVGHDTGDHPSFMGIAPNAKLTSIKVGMSNGAMDVSQMLAAIDWVVKHRNDDPKNPIRVLNLSYGNDSTQSWMSNSVDYAVENAVEAGIVVVVAAGNSGSKITTPALDAHPIVVGSVDPNGTTNPSDDTVSDFSSKDGRMISIDVVAPGRSIVSLRDPGSYVDTLYPSARVGDRFFKGSGTSQAAAVVSGVVALYLQKYPTADPAAVRIALWGTLTGLLSNKAAKIDLGTLLNRAPLNNAMTIGRGTGNASLQGARGTSVVTFGDNTALTGENDIFGPFSTSNWATASAAQTSWSGGSWMGHAWTGTTWGTATNGQANWNGATWSGRAWSGRAWSDVAWSGRAWSSAGWSGTNTDFTGRAWSGAAWSGAIWQ